MPESTIFKVKYSYHAIARAQQRGLATPPVVDFSTYKIKSRGTSEEGEKLVLQRPDGVTLVAIPDPRGHIFVKTLWKN